MTEKKKTEPVEEKEEELVEDSKWRNREGGVKKRAPDPMEGVLAENEQLRDQLLRTAADAENTRKRIEKQVEDTARFAVSNFAKDLINTMENLYRATHAIENIGADVDATLKSIADGVEMTKRELMGVFEKYGIRRIHPAKGDIFDHNVHQAVAQIPDEQLEHGQIIEVMQAGYVIHDRLLRPAMVTTAAR